MAENEGDPASGELGGGADACAVTCGTGIAGADLPATFTKS